MIKRRGNINESDFDDEKVPFVPKRSSIGKNTLRATLAVAAVAVVLGIFGVVAFGLVLGPDKSYNYLSAHNFTICQDGRSPGSPLKLRIMTQNMWLGISPFNSLGTTVTVVNPLTQLNEAIQGFPFTLPSSLSLNDAGYYLLTATEQDVQRSFENMWQQVHNESMGYATVRMTQLADNIALQNPDIIALQEVLHASNNPMVYLDGTSPIQFPYHAGNHWAGDENVTDLRYRTYVYTDMLIQRLRDHHGLEYELASQLLTDFETGPRTQTYVEDATARLQWTMGHAILIRKSLHARVLHERSEEFRYPQLDRGGLFRSGNITNATTFERVSWIGLIRRGWNEVDIDICGKTFRLLNTHLPSDGNVRIDGLPEWNEPWATPSAQRPLAAYQLLRERIAASPYPTILAGDLNTNPCAEEDDIPYYTCHGWATIVGKVHSSNNSYTDNGGPMIDGCVDVHGDCSGAEHKTASLSSGGALYTRLRRVAAVPRIRIDHIMRRRGDPITFDTYHVATGLPNVPTIEKPFAYPADHLGLVADVSIH